MSGALALPIVTGVPAAFVDGFVSVLLRPQRRIGLLFPNVVLDESHSDELAITRHPVQTGANITDHAYKEPAQVTIRAAYSSSSYSALLNIGDIAGTLSDGLLGDSYVQQVYNELIQLQQDREPFDVITGKRSYSNMLLASLSVFTDKYSEYALMFRVVCQQVIIVTSSSSRLPARALQRNPSSTDSPSPTGQVSPTPVDTRSSLRILGGPGSLFR